MDISGLSDAMTRYGIDDDSFAELTELAARVDGTFIEAQLPGMDGTESAVLTSRLLRQMASECDVAFEHPDVIAEAKLPVVEPRPVMHAMADEDGGAETQTRYAI